MEDILITMRRPIVANVLARYPDLGRDGFKTSHDDVPDEFWPSFFELRTVLLSEWAIGQIAMTSVFLRTAMQKCPDHMTNIDSDKLTNLLRERSAPHGPHMVNLGGAVIVAAIICGLEVVRKKNPSSATISFTPHSRVAS